MPRTRSRTATAATSGLALAAGAPVGGGGRAPGPGHARSQRRLGYAPRQLRTLEELPAAPLRPRALRPPGGFARAGTAGGHPGGGGQRVRADAENRAPRNGQILAGAGPLGRGP